MFDHLGDEGLQVFAAHLAGLQNLLVVGKVRRVVLHDALVGDERQAEHAHVAVASHDHLRDCAHTCNQTVWKIKNQLNCTLVFIKSEQDVVVRAFSLMVRWIVGSILHGQPIELFLIPASAPRLV